jgi:hypothetical protein
VAARDSGTLALERKNASESVNDLQPAEPPIEFGQVLFVANLSCLYPTYIRGEAHLAAGQGKEAADEFQKILDHSGIVWNCWTGALAHLGLGRANALQAKTSQGADADAARVRALAAYKDFLTLWKDADPITAGPQNDGRNPTLQRKSTLSRLFTVLYSSLQILTELYKSFAPILWPKITQVNQPKRLERSAHSLHVIDTSALRSVQSLSHPWVGSSTKIRKQKIKGGVMVRKALLAALVAVCLALPALGQTVGDYLDVYIVQVKPDKAADFEALARKIADANRKNNGDKWLALESVYGENNTYAFVSTRQSYADLDKAQESFMGALNKAYGKDGSQKMLNEWNNYIAGARSEFRKRRWDLSRKAPTDPGAYAKFIGNSRVVRTTAVHVRPGKIAEFEAMLKEFKDVSEKADNTQPVLVSQVIEGSKGTVFYISGLRSGLDGFDKNPTNREILGEEGYKKFLEGVSETVESTDSTIFRYSAELSAPPEQVIAAAPDFWNPKPVVAAAKDPKSKTTGETTKK